MINFAIQCVVAGFIVWYAYAAPRRSPAWFFGWVLLAWGAIDGWLDYDKAFAAGDTAWALVEIGWFLSPLLVLGARATYPPAADRTAEETA